MPALNFQAQFATLVESGQKAQTIRAPRKDGRDPKRGDTLHLFTGMRTKACRRLGRAVCSHTYPVEIRRDVIVLLPPIGDVYRGGTWKADDFARKDGFADFDEMRDWFERTHGLPFTGRVIRWELLEGDNGT